LQPNHNHNNRLNPDYNNHNNRLHPDYNNHNRHSRSHPDHDSHNNHNHQRLQPYHNHHNRLQPDHNCHVATIDASLPAVFCRTGALSSMTYCAHPTRPKASPHQF